MGAGGLGFPVGDAVPLPFWITFCTPLTQRGRIPVWETVLLCRHTVPHCRTDCAPLSGRLCPPVRKTVSHSREDCDVPSGRLCPTVGQTAPSRPEDCVPLSGRLCRPVRLTVYNCRSDCAVPSGRL
ncbi:hypothetical protein AVEN_56017-1 [Araneus ventricosus]|uniref:Uncharacterized protein n=1 Tax=Araneus ventricosus TaxID=182803 RepID=A0A4Y2ARS5_ARAVE|nr:hypothetical protein AVEN_56017-1 [Araneus ventricosus]